MIANILSLFKSVAGTVIRKAEKFIITIQKHSGRPKILIIRDLIHMKILLRRQPLFPMVVHWTLFCDTVKIAFGTYQTAVPQAGFFFSYQTLRKYLLKAYHAYKRRIVWAVENWNKAVWPDEPCLCLFGSSELRRAL